MYGFPRLKTELASLGDQTEIIPAVLESWQDFTGEDHEQEDDITLVTLGFSTEAINNDIPQGWTLVTAFEISSQQGNERQASQRVLEALTPFDLAESQEQRLGTAVAEATMNAMEHGNQFQENLHVQIEVLNRESAVAVRIRDYGQSIIDNSEVMPDLDAKLDGLQSPRGWGLFLIKNMVDEMNIYQDDQHHTIELIVNRKG